MVTQYQAIIEAFRAMSNSRRINEIEDWILKNYEVSWKDIGTTMADMVSEKNGGNSTSHVPEEYRLLTRVSRGVYRLNQE